MKQLAREINEKIKSSNLYKNYLICKDNVESNEYLKGLKLEMENLKKKNCKGINDDLIKKYYELEKIYLNNILVKEYESSKKEMYNLLNEISDILSVK